MYAMCWCIKSRRLFDKSYMPRPICKSLHFNFFFLIFNKIVSKCQRVHEIITIKLGNVKTSSQLIYMLCYFIALTQNVYKFEFKFKTMNWYVEYEFNSVCYLKPYLCILCKRSPYKKNFLTWNKNTYKLYIFQNLYIGLFWSVLYLENIESKGINPVFNSSLNSCC